MVLPFSSLWSCSDILNYLLLLVLQPLNSLQFKTKYGQFLSIENVIMDIMTSFISAEGEWERGKGGGGGGHLLQTFQPEFV